MELRDEVVARMTSLPDFLLAMIEADEAVAAHGDGGLMDGDAHFTAARVLADCAARRAIVERAIGPVAHAGQDIERRATLRDLASVYADHPDFDRAWVL